MREQRGMRQYHRMPSIMTGTITGVEVKFMGTLRPQDREVFIRSASAIADVEEELRLTAEEDSGLSVDRQARVEGAVENEESESRRDEAGGVSVEASVKGSY